MKILIITGTTEPTSGLGRYSSEIIKEMRRQGEHVFVVSESGDRDIPLQPRHGWTSIIKNIWNVRTAARSVDVVHALDVWPFAIYGFFAVIGTRKPFYISGVGTYSVPPKSFSLKRFLMLAAYWRTQHVFCISAYAHKRIVERIPFACTMSVVHLATTPIRAADIHIVSGLRSRYHVTSDTYVVLTVGGIKDRKGQLDTFRAVIEARKTYPKLVYIIIGDESDITYVNKIKEVAKKHNAEDAFRIISDASSDKELSAWYSIANVFALTSNTVGDHFEGFGLVFLEAAYFGVPSVGTTGCGIEDAIVNNETGLLVAQRDDSAIAGAILKILADHEKFSLKVHDFAENFSWKVTVEKYRIVYYN